MKKLLVFGIDSASLAILDKYTQARPGGLFDKMLAGGHVRTLNSTIPSFTAPGWSSFMTGLNPGQHGMFHWRGRYEQSVGRRRFLSSLHLNEATFWHYVQQAGGRVSVSNFPMQYPAPPTHGRYICGTLAPESAPNVSWPVRLIERVREAIPDYRFEMDKGISYMKAPLKLWNHIRDVGLGHAKAFEEFSLVPDLDLAVHVVTITDRVQHFFWHCFDPQHPLHGEAPIESVGNPVIEAYAMAENSLESQWENGYWDNVLLVSDHGAGPSTSTFHINSWLRARGDTILNAEGEVDIEKSLAYSGDEPECGIYVNILERDGFGISQKDYDSYVDGLITELEAVRVPGSGELAFTRALRGDAIYRGAATHLGTDIQLLPRDGVHPEPGTTDEVFTNSARLFGGHRLEGLLIAFGNDVVPAPFGNDLEPLEMVDAFPLMCEMMQLPVPSGLAGKLPVGVTKRPHSSVEFVENLNWCDQVAGLPGPQEESGEIMSRLTELGYI